MDRERLKDVQTSDLKESRVNEDFVGFLKKQGPLIALVILAPIAILLFIYNQRDAKAAKYDEAYSMLANSSLPEAFTEVASKYPDVGTVAIQAYIRSGQAYLNAIRVNASLTEVAASQQQGGEPLGADTSLSDDERTAYLNGADDAFSRALAAIAEDEGGTPDPSYSLLAVSALSGRAAVADARGNADEAKSLYLEAAARAGDGFPHLRARSGTARERHRESPRGARVGCHPDVAGTDGPRRPADAALRRRRTAIDRAARRGG